MSLNYCGSCVISTICISFRKKLLRNVFWRDEDFEGAGFELKEIVIKEWHNCKVTGFLETSSAKYNFRLLTHEYLVVFKKL